MFVWEVLWPIQLCRQQRVVCGCTRCAFLVYRTRVLHVVCGHQKMLFTEKIIESCGQSGQRPVQVTCRTCGAVGRIIGVSLFSLSTSSPARTPQRCRLAFLTFHLFSSASLALEGVMSSFFLCGRRSLTHPRPCSSIVRASVETRKRGRSARNISLRG